MDVSNSRFDGFCSTRGLGRAPETQLLLLLHEQLLLLLPLHGRKEPLLVDHLVVLLHLWGHGRAGGGGVGAVGRGGVAQVAGGHHSEKG